MLNKLSNALTDLDNQLSQWRDHPMYDEWKDLDEVTLLVSDECEGDSSSDEEEYWLEILENQG